MEKAEAIKIIKMALAQIEWDYPMDYAAAFDMAIDALKQESTWKDLEEWVAKLTKESEESYLRGYGDGIISSTSRITEIIEQAQTDFETCEGGQSYFVIDGQRFFTDTGYALEGIEAYVQILKNRIKTQIKEQTDENNIHR